MKKSKVQLCVRIHKLGQLNELNNLAYTFVCVSMVVLTNVWSIQQSHYCIISCEHFVFMCTLNYIISTLLMTLLYLYPETLGNGCS